MEQLLTIAKNLGWSDEQAKDAIGSILCLLQSHLKEQDFEKVEQLLPGAKDLAAEANIKAGEVKEKNAEECCAIGLLNTLITIWKSINNETATTMDPSADPAGETNNMATNGNSNNNLESIPELVTFLGSLGIDYKQVMEFLPKAIESLEQNCNLDVAKLLHLPATGGANEGGSTTTTTTTGGIDVDTLVNEAKGLLDGMKQ